MHSKHMSSERNRAPGRHYKGGLDKGGHGNVDHTSRLGLVAIAVAGLSFGFTCQAQAGEAAGAPVNGSAPTGYEMVVIADRAEGAALLRGHYRQAAAAIASGQGVTSFESANNLCVARTQLGELAIAKAHCEHAVARAAQRVEKGARRGHDYEREWAAALSNRGVLRARSGDPAGAMDDFRAALELRPESAAPQRNVARLEDLHPTAASDKLAINQ